MPTSSELKKKSSRRHRGNSDFRLSWFLILFMLLSMISGIIAGTGQINLAQVGMTRLTLAVACEISSWLGLPLVAWIFLKHFEDSDMPWRYGTILFLLAAVCEAPYDYVSTGKWIDWTSQNPLWVLPVCAVVIAAWQWLGTREEFTRWIWRIIVIIGALTWAYIFRLGLREQILYQGIVILGFVVIFLCFTNKENTLTYIAGAWGALSLLTPGIGVLFLHRRNDTEGYPSPAWRWMLLIAYPLLLAVFCFLRYLS